MTKKLSPLPSSVALGGAPHEEGDLSDLLSELRILLPGAQMLTAFLIILPFNAGARQIVLSERLCFLATFFFAMCSLILLSAPAIQHRLMRPLVCRARFKRLATRQIVAGSGALALALVLGTNLVISTVFGRLIGNVASLTLALAIVALWWILPLHLKRHHCF